MQNSYPDALLELMELLRSLPGVGRRSAERMALAIYKWDEDKLEALSGNLHTLKQRVCLCPECGNLAGGKDENGGLCCICASPLRDASSICVVEEATQIRIIEASGTFKGHYHVLGGRIAPLEGKGIDSISIEALEHRIEQGEIREIILALSPDVEGQATALYLAKRLSGHEIRISRLAQGLPAGSDLSYADPATIAAALSGRIDYEQEGR